MIKNSLLFFLQILKKVLFDTSLAESQASNFIQWLCFWVKVKDFTVRHIHVHEDKMTSKTTKLKIAACERSLLYMQNKSLKVWKF